MSTEVSFNNETFYMKNNAFNKNTFIRAGRDFTDQYNWIISLIMSDENKTSKAK